jgi:hypothetical protein
MKANLATPVRSSMGYAEMARRVWPGFSKVFDPGIVEIPMQMTNEDLGTTCAEMHKTAAHQSPDATIVNMVPILFARYATKNTVGYTTFEANQIPADWAQICNKQTAILTTTEWNRTVMIESGVKVPVIVVEPIFTDTQSSPKSDGVFRFYSSFQWSARKNPEGLIRAFVGAFDGRSDVELTIKTHIGGDEGADRAKISAEIKRIVGLCLAKSPPKIRLVVGNIRADKLLACSRQANAHISLSFGEGWGLPAWEAVESGQPLICTDWGAYSEWAKGNPFLVDSRLQPIYGMEKSISPFYNSSMRWGDPSISSAIDHMRWVVSNQSLAKEQAGVFAKSLEKYSAERQELAFNKLQDLL